MRSYTVKKNRSIVTGRSEYFRGPFGTTTKLAANFVHAILRKRDGHLHYFTKSKSDGGLT